MRSLDNFCMLGAGDLKKVIVLEQLELPVESLMVVQWVHFIIYKMMM